MSIAALLFFGSAGLLLCATLQAAFFVAYNIHRRMLSAFALAAFFSSTYQLCSGIYYTDAGLGVSLLALRLQTASACFALVFVFWFVGEYTRYKFTYHLLPVVAGWALAACAINLFSPGTIRFSSDFYIAPIELPWEEIIYPITADVGPWSWFFHLGATFFLLWIAYRAVALYYEKKWRYANLLSIFIVVQLFAGLFGSMVDSGAIEFFYIAGFATLFLLVMLGFSFVLDVREGRDLLSFVKKDLDITRQTSNQLELDNTLLTRCFDQLPVGVQVINKEFELLRDNFATAIPSKLRVGLTKNILAELGERKPTIQSAIERAFRGEVVDLEEQNFGTDLKPDWVKFYLYPIQNPQSENHIDRVVVFSENYNTKHEVQRVIGKIAEAVSGGYEEDLFIKMLENVRSLFGADVAFIGETFPFDNPKRVRIISGLHGEQDIANIEYELKDTPCDGVVGKEMCIYSSGIQQLFPKDEMLQEMGMDGYIGVPVFDNLGRARGLVVVMDSRPLKDITNRKAVLEIIASRAGSELQRINSEIEISRLAYEDYVTRLPNRSRLHLELKKIFEEKDIRESSAHVFLLDLDFFNNVNDGLGHDLGDEVLRLLAERFTKNIPDDDFVARFGGDEFIFINFPEKSKISSVQNFSARLLDLVSQPLKIGDHYLSLGASVGCAIVPEHAQNELQILRCIELALNKAKASGRNRYEIFNPDLIYESNERFVIRNELKQAIEDDQFDLFVQPQLDSSGRSIGAEALIRWQHPDRGFMPPSDFIPIAEESGMIHALGEWVIRRACKYISDWQRLEFPFGRLSINISAWQLSHPDFEKNLLSSVADFKVNPKQLTLEVTETSILREINSTISILDRLRKQGFRVALDDFGTGYSSLAYLRDLPLDELKIDRSFVDVLDEPKSKALVSSMIAISKNMNLEVVAEGVESASQQKALEKLGCEYFQGYLYARPMSESDFRVWLEEHKP